MMICGQDGIDLGPVFVWLSPGHTRVWGVGKGPGAGLVLPGLRGASPGDRARSYKSYKVTIHIYLYINMVDEARVRDMWTVNSLTYQNDEETTTS